MELFSYREGYREIKDFQKESMDKELRNRLWNIFCYTFESKIGIIDYYDSAFIIKLLNDFFKIPYDDLFNSSSFPHNINQSIKNFFMNEKWYKVYDFIEFLLGNDLLNNPNEKKYFVDNCNKILKEENSAYRVIHDKVVEITSEKEISEINECFERTSEDEFKPVNIHLKSALDLLANRNNPDYRNSIKESISAIESLCKIITKEEKATLGNLLDKMNERMKIHPSLLEAFNKLYGYTSDSNGIRHGLYEEPNLDYEDAKFMLVACSAFINYIKIKIEKYNL